MNLTRNSAEELMSSRGFFLSMASGDGYRLNFFHQEAGINCAIDILSKDEEFQLTYIHKMFSINSGKASPLTNDKLFSRLFNKLDKIASILKEHDD